MSGFTFELTGLDAALAQLTKLADATAKEITEELNQFGLNTVNEAKRLAPVDEGALRNSISHQVKSTKTNVDVTLSVNVDYAAYIEFGTRKFAAQYVNSLPAEWQTFAAQFKGKSPGDMEQFVMRLVEWVKRKGIGKTYDVKTRRRTKVGKQSAQTTAEADAYAIALHILRNGIRPHPFLYPAFQKNKIELINSLKKRFA